MTSIFTIDEHSDVWEMLPGGVEILALHHYSQPEARGVLVGGVISKHYACLRSISQAVSIAAIISILAIVSLFIAIGVCGGSFVLVGLY
jgi:hypothetical protein